MKMLTWVFKHPEVRVHILISALTYPQAEEYLRMKARERGDPRNGWKLIGVHADEHSDPSMDRNVQWTDWNSR